MNSVTKFYLRRNYLRLPYKNQTCHLVFLLQNFSSELFGRYYVKYYIIFAKRILELVTVSLLSNLNACQC